MTSGGRVDRAALPRRGGSLAARIIAAPAGGVDVDHPDAEPRGRGDRAGDGVRDVVELQVEEDAIAARDELLDDARAVAVNSRLPILKPPTAPRSASARRAGFGRRIDVERDEELIHSRSRVLVSSVPTSRRCGRSGGAACSRAVRRAASAR